MAELSTKDVVLAAAEKLDELVRSHYELKGQIQGVMGQVQDHEGRLRRHEEISGTVATLQTVSADHENRIRKQERFRSGFPKAATVMGGLSLLGTIAVGVLSILK